jgi:hypothetical protein
VKSAIIAELFGRGIEENKFVRLAVAIQVEFPVIPAENGLSKMARETIAQKSNG